MSIAILLLTAIAGMAVDLGNWYLRADRLQKAADAAALAGSPYLPGNPARARAEAERVLLSNDIMAQNISTTAHVTGPGANPWQPLAYIAPDEQHPNVLKVEVGVKVRNYFLGLIGVNDQWLKRVGNSNYQAKVPMGNPGNVLGTEAIGPLDTSVQQSNVPRLNAGYWLNIAGGSSNKANGDRYTAGKCSNPTDGCANGKNAEQQLDSAGNPYHDYLIHIGKTVTGPVTLQAFDAAFVDVGDLCNSYGTYGDHDLGSAALNQMDPVLYAKGPASGYCTGDYGQSNGAALQNKAPLLTFKVFKADTKNAITGGSLGGKTFPGLRVGGRDDLASQLNANSDLRNSFRKWASIYQFDQPGDYIVRASTPITAQGSNRFSLRLGAGTANTGWMTNQATVDQLSISAKHHLAVYTNASSDQAKFYFAKLGNNAAGRTLELELFDIGDAGNMQSVNVALLKPTASQGMTAFQNCRQTGPGTLNPGYLTNCEIKQASPTYYNGRSVKVKFTVPETYTCYSPNDPSGCWMALQFKVNGANNISASNPSNDTSTWQINDCGSPLKLVKNNGYQDDSCSVN